MCNMITAGSLEGRKKRRREIPATGTLLNTRQSASSASSGQLRDSRSDHRADGTRLDGHIYAQSMQNVPVSTVPGSDQQRSFSMDDGIEGTHSSQSQNVVSCQHYHVLQPPPDFPYPRSDTFQSYFDAGLSANPRQGPLQTDEHVDQYRASFERQSDNGLLMMTSPRWNVPTETRAPRAEPMVSPLTQSEPDSYRNNEYPDEVAEGQIHRENGISLRCGRRSVDRSAPDYDIDFDKSFKLAQLYGYGVDKFNSDFATNSVVDTEYTHPAGVSEKYYQSSLASSSESDSMNSAGPRTERYYSVDSLESSSSQLRDPNTTSQKHTYYPPPAPRRGNSPTHYEDSRESHDSQYSGQV